MYFIKKYSYSLFFLLIHINLNSYNQYNLTKAGLTNGFSEVKDFFNGLNSLLAGFSSFSNMIGFSTIILFLVILLLSTGLSAIGIPRGKISFLFSLIIADILWIFWKESFNPDSLSYLIPVIRSSIIILIPFIITILIQRFFPSLSGKIYNFIKNLFKKKKSMEKEDLLLLSKELNVRRKNQVVIGDF